MDFKELQTKLISLTNRNISQTEIGEALGITRSTTSTRFKTKSELKTSELKKIADYFNVYFDLLLSDVSENQTLSNNSDVSAYYYPDVFGSCGNGTFVLSEVREKISIPRYCFETYSKFKKYSIINARGESMLPYIQDKDLLIVEHWEGEQIYDNCVYVFCYDEQIFVKRLIKNVDELIIKSDNPDPIYRPRYASKDEMNRVIIIGQIVGLIRTMR